MTLKKYLLGVLLLALSVANGLLIAPENTTALLLTAYEYVVVGGGTAGLALANRLTEDANVTVLVLEAGPMDASEALITVPAMVGQGFIDAYNWNFTTLPQTFLDNRPRSCDAGHVVGGSSILNGLVWTRGSRPDYDAWKALGNDGWGWDNLVPYFKKSENFAFDLSPADAQTYQVNPDLSAHGTAGPVEVTYPSFVYKQTRQFLSAATEHDFQLLPDLNDGTGAGAILVPSSISAKNQSRADSRTAYLDPILGRPNLHLAAEQTVTRLLLAPSNQTVSSKDTTFQQDQQVLGVEFVHAATPTNASRMTVNCTGEVILSAGAVMSPILLQLSGIGPASLLDQLKIPVQVDLPGVGQNFQDHAMVGAFYNYTNPAYFTANDIIGDMLNATSMEYYNNRTGPWTAPLISTVAFPSIHQLANSSHILSLATADDPTIFLPPGTGQHDTVAAGYKLQYQILQELLRRRDAASAEIMADSIGTLTAAIQRPLSRGTVQALASDLLANVSVSGDHQVRDNVAVDPRYCAHPVDCTILVDTLHLAGEMVQGAALQELWPMPTAPWNTTYGSEYNATALMDVAKARLQTEFHGAGSTSMLPLQFGGVVDARLRVYGVTNLRVVDAGIMPLLPAAHLQAVVYAIAEKGADMIKQDRLAKGNSPVSPFPFPFDSGPKTGSNTSIRTA